MLKKRLDVLLLDRGFSDSRQRAKAIIKAGEVYVNNQRADKPGELFLEDAQVELRGTGQKYVSRGGLKLERAIAAFSLELGERVCMDVGASTGGFTDCMLQNGAKQVYAIDVGYDQLAQKLRCDPRVVNLERTNARGLTRQQVPAVIDFFSMDVSFISMTLILPAVRELLSERGSGVCLIKPQFEAGREKVGKNGVVRDPRVHIEVIEKIIDFSLTHGFSVLGLDYSPVKGPQGNIEYLIYLGKADVPELLLGAGAAGEVVKESHAELDK